MKKLLLILLFTNLVHADLIPIPQTETDPVFLASDVNDVNSTDIGYWDTAYGWGDHLGLYDPNGEADEEIAILKGLYDFNDIANGATAYGWGDWNLEDFNDITNTDKTNWDTAYGWGDWNTNIDISTDTNLTAGDHITLTDDDLDIDDDFLLNTGDTASGDYNFGSALYIDSVNNFLGFGIEEPQLGMHISVDNKQLAASLLGNSSGVLSSAENTYVGFGGTVAGSGSSYYRSVYSGTRARGTLASPSAPINNDRVLSFLGAIYDGDENLTTAEIAFIVDGAVSNNVCPQRVSIATGETTSRTERLIVKADGRVFMPDVYSDDVGAVRDLLIKSDGQLGYNSSSVRYKENIKDYKNSDEIYKLRPVEYDRKNGSLYNEKGLIAEEVELADVNIPNLVSYKREEVLIDTGEIDPVDNSPVMRREYYDTDIPETVNYSRLIVPMLKEIQEQKKLIDDLTKRIEVLEKRR